MTTRLTHDQKQALYWLSDQVRAGRLENPFMIVWARGVFIGNVPTPGRAEVVYPDTITEANLSALVAAGRLGEKRTPLYTLYTLYPGVLDETTPASTAAAPPAEAPPAPPAPPAPDDDNARRVRLAHFIDAFFDREELQKLCFELGIDFDNLAGEKKDTKARNLVVHMDNRGRLAQLEQKLAAERPIPFSRFTG